MVLQLKDVVKTFGGLIAVDRVSLSIRQNQIKSIIGPNGAGKTTLFNLINGSLMCDGGEIHFNGQKTNGFLPSRLCRMGMARSFQITNIFQGLTVYENVRLSSQGQIKKLYLFGGADRFSEYHEEAKRILNLIGLWDKRDSLAGDLSHGDQRHLEMGIALASRPTLLLLDEPTAGMTTSESRNTIELIEKFRGKLSILLIEHDIDLVFRVSDEIVVLQQGRLLAEGHPDEIRANHQVQKAYLGEAI